LRNKQAGNNIENVLIIGGTRFSGLYLWKELYDRVSAPALSNDTSISLINHFCILQGYSVTLFNRGKTALAKVPGETDATFQHRLSETQFITGDRSNQEVIFVYHMYVSLARR
jgi:hypothetical protein